MALVRLAGGIVWREAPEGARVALIHRPRQADWSLPKGRIDEGETWEEAAVREVEEETACEARITSFAGAAIYVPRRVPRLADSIYSKRSEEPKPACQRKPTAPLALSSSERRHIEPFGCLPTALRPSRPVQPWVFHQAEKELTASPGSTI